MIYDNRRLSPCCDILIFWVFLKFLSGVSRGDIVCTVLYQRTDFFPSCRSMMRNVLSAVQPKEYLPGFLYMSCKYRTVFLQACPVHGDKKAMKVFFYHTRRVYQKAIRCNHRTFPCPLKTYCRNTNMSGQDIFPHCSYTVGISPLLSRKADQGRQTLLCHSGHSIFGRSDINSHSAVQ